MASGVGAEGVGFGGGGGSAELGVYEEEQGEGEHEREYADHDPDAGAKGHRHVGRRPGVGIGLLGGDDSGGEEETDEGNIASVERHGKGRSCVSQREA